MKIRSLVAAVGVTLLATLAAAPASVAVSPFHDYGTRATPGGAVAGGARFAAVPRFSASGRSSKTPRVECSTGVPWRLANGVRGFLTAGQCLPAKVRSGAQIIRSKSMSSWTPGAGLGVVSPGMTTADAKGTIPRKVGDLAFVPSRLPIQNYLFTGGPTSSARTPITSWASKARPGYYTLCFSGAQSGIQCGLTQGKGTSYVKSYLRSSQKYTGLAEAHYDWRDPDHSCPRSGDTGGAVYRMSPDGRSAYVMGIISGSQNTFFGCSMFYTPLSAAVSQFHGGPIIS